MKLKVISGQKTGMMPQGSTIQSKILVAGHQVLGNLIEFLEFTIINLYNFADLQQKLC